MVQKRTRIFQPIDSQISIFLMELENNQLFFELHNDNNSNTARELWQTVVDQLNNEPGPKYDIPKWRQFFSNYKFKTRNKLRGVAFDKHDMSRFKPLQQRLLIILGQIDMNTCRGCFKTNKEITSNQLYPLFEDDHSILTDKAKIYSTFIKIKITKFDMLPNFLCEECWSVCKEWYDFQIQCNNCFHNRNCHQELNAGHEINKLDSSTITTRNTEIKPIKKNHKKEKVNNNKKEEIIENIVNIEEILIKQEAQDNLPPYNSHTTILTPPTNIKDDNFQRKEFDIYDPLQPIEIKLENPTADYVDSSNLDKQTESSTKIDHKNVGNNILNISTINKSDNLDIKTNDSYVEIKKEEDYEEINDIMATAECDDGFSGNEEDLNSNLSNDFNNDDDEFVTTKSSIKSEDQPVTDTKMKKLIVKKDFTHLECDICSKLFTQRHTILDHLLKHRKNTNKLKKPGKSFKKQFACFECGSKFIKQSELKLHMKTHNSEPLNNNNKCDICGKVFQLPSRLRRHSKRHDPTSKCKCLDCGKIYATSAELSAHEKTHMRKRSYPCHLCAKSFKKLLQLNVHGQVHGNAEKIHCEICDKSFIYPQILERHRKIHLKPSDNPELDEERYMNEEGPQPCTMCKKVYKSKKSLRDHVYTCHKPLERRYLCAECGKNFLKPNLLRTHMLSHVTEANFSCTDCDKRFKCEKRLRKHQQWHDPTAIKFICSECGKQFTTSAQLVTHSRTHTGERPYVCPICKKSFKTTSQLNTHNRIHTGARPFSCNICHMTFTYLDVLKRHKNSHTGKIFISNQLPTK